MRPPNADHAVTWIRRDVPEFENRFLDLLDLYGEDLSPEVVFMELADFVSELLVSCGSPGTLDRCFAIADEVAGSLPDGRELIGYSFLNQLPPGVRLLARPHLPAGTEELLSRLERGEAVNDDDGEA